MKWGIFAANCVIFGTVFAQAQPSATDFLAGGSGWVGTSLLGAVLSWVFFVRLPANDKMQKEKDEQISKMVESYNHQFLDFLKNYDLQRKLEREAHDTARKEERADFQLSLKLVTEHCEKDLEKVTSAYLTTGELLKRALDNTKGT